MIASASNRDRAFGITQTCRQSVMVNRALYLAASSVLCKNGRRCLLPAPQFQGVIHAFIVRLADG